MDKKPSKPSQKRRAILQGSLAAPVVLTVSSASAQMVSSHLTTCADNIRQPTDAELRQIFFVDEQRYLSTADTWLRAPVTVKLFEHGNDPVDWFYFDKALGDHVRISDLKKLKELDGWHEVKGVAAQTQTRWALVWVDKRSGTPIVVSLQQPSNSQFTMESCNASVNPTIKL